MNQTENYNLSQWAKTDRILMVDFNADNAKIDAALGGKLEFVELMDVTETLENATYWNLPLDFKLYDYVAVFLEYFWPDTTLLRFAIGRNGALDLITMNPSSASIACFPLRNPAGPAGFISIANQNDFNRWLKADYQSINCFSIHAINNGPALNGTYRLRITALR